MRTPLSPAPSSAADMAHSGPTFSRPSHTKSPEPVPSSRFNGTQHLAASSPTPISASKVSVRFKNSRQGPVKGHKTTSVVYDEDTPNTGPARCASDNGNVISKASSSKRKRTNSSFVDNRSPDSKDNAAYRHYGRASLPNQMKYQEALEAYIKGLQNKRDAKRCKMEEEQVQTETMAVSHGLSFDCR